MRIIKPTVRKHGFDCYVWNNKIMKSIQLGHFLCTVQLFIGKQYSGHVVRNCNLLYTGPQARIRNAKSSLKSWHTLNQHWETITAQQHYVSEGSDTLAKVKTSQIYLKIDGDWSLHNCIAHNTFSCKDLRGGCSEQHAQIAGLQTSNKWWNKRLQLSRMAKQGATKKTHVIYWHRR